MPLSQFVTIFLLEEVAFLLYTLLVLRSSQFCFEFLKKCDQVQKLVRPWPDQPDRFRRNTINDENKYKSKDHLFMFKTTIMVNKREKIYYIIPTNDYPLSVKEKMSRRQKQNDLYEFRRMIWHLEGGSNRSDEFCYSTVTYNVFITCNHSIYL